MSMMPYFNLFEKQARKETREVTFKGDPLIPDDDYGLLEYYCGDPECDCQMVMIGVVSRRQKKQIATIVYTFDPAHEIPGMSNPDLDLAPQAEFAKAFLQWFADLLRDDHAYEDRLKRHYTQVKNAETNPAHPMHAKFLAWQDEDT